MKAERFRFSRFDCDTTYRMKAARFFPLAFLANVHGFILLAPYLIAFLTVVRLMELRRGSHRPALAAAHAIVQG